MVLTAKTFKGKHKTLTGTSRVVGDGVKANKPSVGKYGYPLGHNSTDFKIFCCLQRWYRRYICSNAWRNHEVAKFKVCS